MKSTPKLTRRAVVISGITAAGGCVRVVPGEQTVAVSGVSVSNETPSAVVVNLTLRKQEEEVLRRGVELGPIGGSDSVKQFHPVWTMNQTTYRLHLSGGGAQPVEKAIPKDTESGNDCIALSVQLKHTGQNPFEQSPAGGDRFFGVTAYDPAHDDTFDDSCNESSNN